MACNIRGGNAEKIKNQPDVTIATKNSARTLEKCVESIRTSIPCGRIVVVDGASTDDTRRIARKYGAVVMQETGMLGRVRYAQAKACKTKWVAYVDSDVYLYPSWWPEVSRFTQTSDVGMVVGFADAPLSRLRVYDAYLKYLAGRHGAIAFSNTLIRRQLVLECRKELSQVHAGEDDIVAAHVRQRGFRIITLPKTICYHDKDPFISHPRDFFRAGQSLRMRWGVWGVVVCTASLRRTFANWRHFTVDSRRVSLKLLVFLLELWFWMFAGFMDIYSPCRKVKV